MAFTRVLGSADGAGIHCSDPAQEAQVALAALQAFAQRKVRRGMNAFSSYTVKHIREGLTLFSDRVIVKRNVNGSQIIDALRTDGIYQYTYIGHGEAAWINTYPDDGNLIVAPDRYTLYGINLMNLFACESASVDILSAKMIKRTKRRAWRSNVANVGTFYGYSNEVTLINQHVFTVIRKGMNSNEKK